MARKKNPWAFGGFKEPKAKLAFASIKGADNAGEMNRPLPLKRRFRPRTGTLDQSVTSEYDYTSLYSRWRRGYELYQYGQQAYDGLTYSFRYFINTPGIGVFLPGLCAMYPSIKTDMRMNMVAIRPRDAFNFLDFGQRIADIIQIDENTIACTLSFTFGAPISFFADEVVENRYDNTGAEKQSGFSSYTVVGVGANNVIIPPSPFPIYNQLFLSIAPDKSWNTSPDFVLSAGAQLPNLGEFFSTAMRYGCSCPDYLQRKNFNLWSGNFSERYPVTQTLNVSPGVYDPGSYPGTQQRPFNQSKDDPGYARDFGRIYLNNILDIPNASEVSYSEASTLFFRPRWCKHIYAAMWELRGRFGQIDLTTPWLPQPADEPLNEYYREHFEIKLQKEMKFLYRQKELGYWQKYSPARDDMPDHLVYPDMYNMCSKVLNVGGSGIFDQPVESGNFQMFDLNEFDPFLPPGDIGGTFDGGIYSSGVYSGPSPLSTLDGGSYINGALVPPPGIPDLINGGTY